ncbi:putative ATP-dependent RNA helicase DBP5 [Phytophthora infestans]|uniref:Putative ATP-dependent RNA helicase DBP5 n=1 Tax=Phytophthora infestans TaxID=4787 RepID=A0A8S9VD09_PHYIN|nr:putative ATP-dependent RNA helicase DBP5 [Phytophthora infestans]
MSETDAAAKTTEEVAPPVETENKTEDAVEEVTQSLEDILALGQGLDDEDYKAELEVLQNDPNSNLYSAVTFEELNLPDPLLKGVYNMKFAKPSKIQSVALPLILAE